MLPAIAATGTLVTVAIETKVPLLELPACELDFEERQAEDEEEQRDLGSQEKYPDREGDEEERWK